MEYFNGTLKSEQEELIEISAESEKKKKWDEKMAELDQYGNKPEEDIPIDDNIKETIASLNLLGIPTSASCGGHFEGGDVSYPMIQGIFETEEENNASRQRIEALVDEFNSVHNDEDSLIFNPEVLLGYRIESSLNPRIKQNKESLDEGDISPIETAQSTFSAFTEFLKSKYFS